MAEPTGDLAALRTLLDQGPDPDSPARHRVLAPLVRRVVLRLLGHFREHQTGVDRQLLAALEQHAEDVKAQLADLDDRLRRLADDVSSRDDHLSGRLDASWSGLANLALQLPAPPEGVDAVKRLLAEPNRRPPATLLQTDVGPMLYPADDAVLTPWVAAHGSWEPEESQFLRRLLRPGMGFVDIGAHVGYVSLLAAECIGSDGLGIALEPAPANFALLTANLLLAGASRIVPVPAAAWRTTGEVQLGLSPDNTGDHRVSGHRPGPTVSVPAVALDDLLPADLRVGVIKVDAQGRDHVALEGAIGTIAKSRPVVLVEYWPEGIVELGDEPESVLDFYRSLGFSLRMLGDELDCSKNSCVVEAASAKPGGYGTLILNPRDGHGDL